MRVMEGCGLGGRILDDFYVEERPVSSLTELHES